MTNYLHIALWIVFFYDAIVMLLLPSSVNFILGTDGSAARYVVDFISLAIAGYVLINSGFKKLENKWIALFLLVLVISHFHSPNIKFDSTFVPKDMALYNYKPMFEILVFFLMFMGVSSIEFTKESINKIFKSICWIAVIYGVYILLQKIGLDQLYKITGEQQISQMSRNPECGGFISQPVFAAAFLSLCLPFIIKNGSYWMMAIVVAGILATGNRSSYIAALICSMMMNPILKNIAKGALLAYLSFLVGSLILHCILPSLNLHFSDTGRLEVWKNLFYDFFNPSFPGINTHYILTGHGIGSFSVLFPFFHHSGFYQAHNEVFEVIYTTGLCGLIVFILMVKDLLKKIFINPISLGILAISICAMTNAVWHIPQLAFITVFLVGLSYNKTIQENLYVT